VDVHVVLLTPPYLNNTNQAMCATGLPVTCVRPEGPTFPVAALRWYKVGAFVCFVFHCFVLMPCVAKDVVGLEKAFERLHADNATVNGVFCC
jgi:hypothetical protein